MTATHKVCPSCHQFLADRDGCQVQEYVDGNLLSGGDLVHNKSQCKKKAAVRLQKAGFRVIMEGSVSADEARLQEEFAKNPKDPTRHSKWAFFRPLSTEPFRVKPITRPCNPPDFGRACASSRK